MPDNLAMETYSSAAHFANNLNFEVQRANHFEVVLDLSKIPFDNNDGDMVAEHIRLSTKEFGAPKISAESIPLKHGNETIKVAAAPSFEDIDITVYDTLGKDQLSVIQSWFNKVFDYKTKLMGRVTDYKADGQLFMYSPDCKVIRTWKLFGVWPKGFGNGTGFSFDSTEAQTVSFSLSVDRFYEETVTNGYSN